MSAAALHAARGTGPAAKCAHRVRVGCACFAGALLLRCYSGLFFGGNSDRTICAAPARRKEMGSQSVHGLVGRLRRERLRRLQALSFTIDQVVTRPVSAAPHMARLLAIRIHQVRPRSHATRISLEAPPRKLVAAIVAHGLYGPSSPKSAREKTRNKVGIQHTERAPYCHLAHNHFGYLEEKESQPHSHVLIMAEHEDLQQATQPKAE